MVTTLLSIGILGCQMGAINNMWTAALKHGSQRDTSAWRTLLILPIVAQLWFASWGNLQGYLVRVDLFSRGAGQTKEGESSVKRGLSARVANLLFVCLFAAFASGVLVSRRLLARRTLGSLLCELNSPPPSS